MVLFELTSIEVRVVVTAGGPLTVKTMVSLFASPIVNGCSIPEIHNFRYSTGRQCKNTS